MSCLDLVIIHNLYVFRLALLPSETNAILVVDANAVKTQSWLYSITQRHYLQRTATLRVTGVAAYVAEAPMACVAMGAGKALENYAIIRRSIGGL
jgi:hypothetical protein